MTATMKTLAARIDVCPADVLWALLSIGHPVFWFGGMRMSREYFLQWLRRDHFDNPIPDVYVDLDESQEAALCAELQVTISELRYGIANVRS